MKPYAVLWGGELWIVIGRDVNRNTLTITNKGLRSNSSTVTVNDRAVQATQYTDAQHFDVELHCNINNIKRID